MEIITSRTNPLCTHLRKLASSVSYRRDCGEFLCDSPKLLEEALLWRAGLRTVVCTDPAALPALPDTVRRVQVPGDLMKSISPAQTPQGVLSVCGLPGRTLPEQLTGRRRALLTKSGLPLYGAALRSDTVDVRRADFSHCAVAVGSEGKGLSADALAACDLTVRIPMSGHCESLNAAAAAAVLLWEAARDD